MSVFLLPFSRDFVCSGCIASFLTRSETRRQRKAVTGEHQEGKFTCSSASRSYLKGHSLKATHLEATHFEATHFAAIPLMTYSAARKASPICLIGVASHQVPAMAHHRSNVPSAIAGSSSSTDFSP